MSIPLLLAPAGNRAAVGAALGAGADAVYVGLAGWSRGGARRELDRAELASAGREAASAGATLQVAINTIPKALDRARMFDDVAALRDLGIDEVIVNDIGILADLKRVFPGVKVTASIGCGARTIADVAFFREVGADAVVLPGSVTPGQARELTAVAGIRIELMVHMVEEFILLGKCWMPSFLHVAPTPFEMRPAPANGESDVPEGALRGIRQTGSMKRGGVGACYRICQQPWRLFSDGRERDVRLLPARQISGIDQVGEYARAGVHVLKLQGRSLPPERLAALVRSYRQAIDSGTAAIADAELTPSLPATWAVVGR